MSSKRSLFGSEGRMRMSCVILQRRLPRRSVFESGCLGGVPVGSFFVIGSCWVAKGKPYSPEKRCAPSEKSVIRGRPLNHSGNVPGRSRTLPENGSTEVLEKEGKGCGKVCGK